MLSYLVLFLIGEVLYIYVSIYNNLLIKWSMFIVLFLIGVVYNFD